MLTSERSERVLGPTSGCTNSFNADAGRSLDEARNTQPYLEMPSHVSEAQRTVPHRNSSSKSIGSISSVRLRGHTIDRTPQGDYEKLPIVRRWRASERFLSLALVNLLICRLDHPEANVSTVSKSFWRVSIPGDVVLENGATSPH